ncbi:MBG domain-containing protein [Hephaestia mangrovi]|uniref:MBG domain-containing protein n=1 Tax=Hephaestia mangrovi TaxID=2873268 RepID=UPI001CA6A3A3|nr:MBG domain-containing protein [Hephaestia mangrovi]MBY8828902.1 filamentous hemagglutinin N-terminal domain-containing protein [Hephaestia mangrovi]
MSIKFPVALLASTALIPCAAAQTLPQGGQVAAGQATISNPAAGQMQIDQSSQRAIINWQSFSVGKGGRVDINQPDATSALLNRVTGNTTSEIAGQINANGRVFLINPNGILITRTGSVNAAGFTASTLDIADADFMAGSDTLTVTAPRLDQSISYIKGGFAGALGGKAGKWVLAHLDRIGGEEALDLGGDGFLQVAVPKGGITVAGRINASEIVLTAGTARAAARGVVNLSGTLDASSVSASGGTIRLTGAAVNLAGARIDASGATSGGSVEIGGGRQGSGDLAHATTVSMDAASSIRADATGRGDGGSVTLWSDERTTFAGTISARGGAAGGDGGQAEVSGKQLLDYTGTTDLTASLGKTGDLLLDPFNVTISDAADKNQSGAFTATGNDSVINVTTLEDALALANVTVSTGSSGSQAGDITVAAPLGWSSNSALTLNAAGSIAINAAIDVAGGGQVALTYSTSDPVTKGLSFALGAGINFADGQTGQALTLNSQGYTLLHTMADVEAVGTGGRYALAHDLDAAGTTYTGALIGPSFSQAFTGKLEGLGHVISNLTIESANDDVGLVGVLSGGGIRDIGIVGGSITGTGNDSFGGIGALVGVSVSGGSVRNAFSTATVSGGDTTNVGGLLGINAGTIVNSFSTGLVSGGANSLVGGLVGLMSNTLKDSYATGAVSGGDGSRVGGLVGDVNSSQIGISNVYATGAVSGGAGSHVGGVVGTNTEGALTNLFWDTDTSGVSSSPGGGTGLTTAQFMSGGANALDGAFADGANGRYPFLASFFPNGVQAISGTARDGSSNVVVGGQVQLFSGGNSIGIGPVSTGANGFYYTIMPTGTLPATGNAIGQTITLAGATAPGGLAYADRLALDGNGNLAGLSVTAGQRDIDTALTNWSALQDSLDATFGSTTLASLSPAIPENVTATGDFAIDQALTPSSDLTVTSGGSLAVDAPVTWSGIALSLDATSGLTVGAAMTLTGGSLALAANTALDVDAPITVKGAGAVNIDADGPMMALSSAGFGGSVTYLATDGSALSSSAGGTLAINGDPITLLYSMADLDGIDGQAASGNAVNAQAAGLDGDYALARDLDASGTTYTSALIGGSADFTGALLGMGHVISGLTIASAEDNIGLVGLNTGLIQDIGLAGGSLTGQNESAVIGALVGSNSGEVDNSYAGAIVGGRGFEFGGLVGGNSGSVSDSFATGAVDIQSSGGAGGGLIGGNGGTVSNAYATGAISAADGGDIGGLSGSNSGTIAGSHATGAVSGNGAAAAGGLVGENFFGTITDSYAIGAVRSDGDNGFAGGLAGFVDQATISNVFATGAVSAGDSGDAGGLAGFVTNSTLNNAFATGAVSGGDSSQVGGLIGFNATTISNVYSTGVVSGGAGADVGGLVGFRNANGKVTNGYWDVETSGQSASAGGIGRTTAQFQNGSLPSGFDSGLWATGAGLYPYLKSFFPDGVQAVTGTITNADGSAASGAAIDVFLNGSQPSLYGAVTSGANGYFYTIVAPGTYAGDSNVYAATLTEAGGSAPSGVRYIDELALDANGNLATGTAQLGLAHATTSLDGMSAFFDAVAVTFGDNKIGQPPVLIDARGDMLVDQQITVPHAYSIVAAGDLTIAPGGSITSGASGDAVVLAAGGVFTNQAGSTALQADNGRWLVYQGTALGGTRGGLAGTSFYGDAFDLASDSFAIAPSSGNRFVYAEQPTLTISATGSGVYDGTVQTGTLSASGLINGDALALSGTATGLTTSGVDAGNYTLTPGGVTSDLNYAITFAPGTYTITPRPITVTADALSRIYGDANPTLTFTVGGLGLVGGDTLIGALATSADTTSDVGSYAIDQGTLTADSNYALSFTGADLTVTPRPITVIFTADPASAIYGNGPGTLTGSASADDLVNGDTLAGITSGSASFTAGADATSDVGSYAITGSGLTATSANYTINFAQAAPNATAFAVTPRAITVTADALSRIYGDTNPALPFTVGGLGLVNGDTLSGALATSADATSDVGSYAITQGTLTADGNYTLSYTGADLSVTPRAITVTADALSRIYGDANPALSFTVGGLGLVNGDTLSGALTTSADATSNIGRYAITQGTLTADSNYALSYAGADLTVTPRPITVTFTADTASAIYGNGPGTLTGSASADDLVNGDTLAGITSGSAAFTTDGGATSDVGSYAITGSGLTATSANYAVSFAQAATNASAFTVTPRAITVAANALSRIYGDTNPALSFTVGGLGLVNGDTLSGALATSADATSDVGSYAITQGTLAAGGNYVLSYTGADLSVTPRAITVTADALNRIYGDTNPALTFTVGGQGLVNGDTLSGALTTSADVTSDVGSFAITQGTLTAGSNYAVSFTGADLTVTPRPITVTANDLLRLFHEDNPPLTFTVGGRGLVNGDVLSGALATSATIDSLPGTFSIDQGTLAATPNYTLVYEPGQLTVAPALLEAELAASSRAGNAYFFGMPPSIVSFAPPGSGSFLGSFIGAETGNGFTASDTYCRDQKPC